MKYYLHKNINFICAGKNALVISNWNWTCISYEFKRNNIINKNNLYLFPKSIDELLTEWQCPFNHGKIYNKYMIENYHYRVKKDLLEKLEEKLQTKKTKEKRSKI